MAIFHTGPAVANIADRIEHTNTIPSMTHGNGNPIGL